jgi:glycolate oxidase FAD binding subunit
MTDAEVGIQLVQDAIRRTGPGKRLVPVAGATKPGLSSSNRDDVVLIDVSGLSGIVDYDPAELTVTALAGTRVDEVERTLAEHGQYLPFDPPLTARGATLGGVVAAGASGPSSLRYGGIRDFIIGVRFVDGIGRLIAGGGKVVKNAAGFDLPKLMVGSMGRLGVMVQLSFKVFPRPAATASLEYRPGTVTQALEVARAVTGCRVGLDALEIVPEGRTVVRIGGGADTLEARLARLQRAVDQKPTVYRGQEELTLWQNATDFTWVSPGSGLVRVGLSVRRIENLDAALATVPGARVRYGLGGTVAWIDWPALRPLAELGALLTEQGLRGMVLLGSPDQGLLGPPSAGAFAQRVTRALDPEHRFLEV